MKTNFRSNDTSEINELGHGSRCAKTPAWSRPVRKFLASLLLLGAMPALAGPVHELIHGFSLPPKNPGYGTPAAGPDGYLWGTTTAGGVYGKGSVYKVKSDGTDLRTVASFSLLEGHTPYAGLVSDGAGNFWGTTSQGGADHGTIFKVNAATGALTTVVEFTANGATNKGREPYAGLTNDGAGNFWGTTRWGGANNLGTVFKVNAATGALTTVVEFTGNGETNKGREPYAGLVNHGAGYFWGTTSSGGSNGGGTVFKVNATTGALTTVVEFTGNGGSNKGRKPYAALVNDGAGYFWGTTSGGGVNNDGTVFKVNAATGELTTLVEFTDNGAINKGSEPYAALVSDGEGYFWGTTSLGGANNYGTVFKVNAATGELTTLVEFTNDGAINTGSWPRAGLVSDGAGNFWGTTNQSGVNSYGTVFKVNAVSGALTTMVEFVFKEGARPAGALVGDGSGNLWGATQRGGPFDRGTIFKFDPAIGAPTTVADFGGTSEGGPNGGLASDGAGNFWGTTYSTVFKVNAATGALTTVLEFTDNGPINKGRAANGGLVRDGAGSFWGTTWYGGANGFGTVFKVNAATGTLTTLVQFTNNGTINKGANPNAGLVSDGVGYFWGTTYFGGSYGNDTGTDGYGTIFKVNAVTGALTTVVEFTGNGASNKGLNPVAGLAFDGAGYLWGTTTYGGTNGYGTLFKLNVATGVLTTLLNFTNNGASNKGAYPAAAMVSDGAGYFWGTTYQGGASGSGTVFKVNAATGVLTTLVQFTGSGAQANTGQWPGFLFKHTDGNFYGSTTWGGPWNGGTIFRLRRGPTPITQAADSISPTAATLRGTVNPNNDGTTTVRFEYGTDPGLSGATVTSATILTNGATASPVSAAAGSLAPRTTYYFRVTASNAGNEVTQQGRILSFTTAAEPDSDGDGLPDAWEVMFGLDPADNGSVEVDNGASGDPDMDGFTNGEEFAAGTHPTYPGSIPVSRGPVIVTFGFHDAAFELMAGNLVPGKTYQLMRAADLSAFSPLGAAVTGVSSVTFTDAAPPPGKGYYRVRETP